MTAWGSVDLAVEAMRRGARDFVQKPWDNARLLAILRTQVELSRALRQDRAPRERAPGAQAGRAAAAHRRARRPWSPCWTSSRRVGRSDANVLITGENGTGKSLIAQLLHAESSRERATAAHGERRRACPTASSRASSSATSRARSPTRAPTAWAASSWPTSGTLFLDEIANVPLALQPKLLRVLETGEFERVGSSRTRTRERADPLGDQRRSVRRGAARAASGRTCSSGSTRSRFRCRRCAIAARTSRRSRDTSCRSTRDATGSHSPGSTRPPSRAHGRSRLAGQRARAGSRRRARRAAGRAPDDSGDRPRTARAARDGLSRLDDMSLEDVEVLPDQERRWRASTAT